MEKTLIAIVTPVYNGEKMIDKSIKSLLAQTFTDWVSIIVNDGSTDKTAEVLDKYKDDKRFIIIHLQKNQGRAVARKIALEKVIEINAKYMCMLDADDLYYYDKLEWQYDYMEKNPELTLMSCSLGYIDDNCNLKGVLESYKEEKQLHYVDYRNYNPVPHACSIIKVKDIGNTTFDAKMVLGQDQDFMIRLLKDKKYSFVPKIGYLYSREHSFSFKKYKKTKLLGIYSKKKLGFAQIELLQYMTKEYLKLFVVYTLSIFNLENVYIKKIGRNPNSEEINNHQKIKNTFFGSDYL